MTRKVGVPGRRVGLLGTGFIAEWHLKALTAVPGARVVAVCDQKRLRAEAFAKSWSVETVFPTLEAMLKDARLDVVHVLIPPPDHVAVCRQILEAGVHVLTEKPLGTEPEACEELADLARKRGLALGVSHNLLFSPAYERLREDVRAGKLGRLDEVTITWNREIGFATTGPFDVWMVAHPANIMLDVGVHSVANLLDLVGEPEEISVRASSPKRLPTGVVFCRHWQVQGTARGGAAVALNFHFRPGIPEIAVRVRGLLGIATADLENNTYTLDRLTPWMLDVDRFVRLRRTGRALCRQAAGNLALYGKLKLARGGNSFMGTLASSLSAFYRSLPDPDTLDGRLSGTFGASVVRLAERIGRLGAEAHHAGAAPPAVAAPAARPEAPPPRILVLGGNGFIGRELVRQLLGAGHGVRILVRRPGSVMLDRADPRLQIVGGDIRHREDIVRALDGIETVYHLARAMEAQQWAEYLRDDVEPTRLLGELCVKHGVQRLIYTGTIASLDSTRGPIRCDTPVDPRVARRDYYSRAKALCEEVLLALHRDHRLGVVILRPAIVIGRGSTPCHMAVGKWKGIAVCQLWGRGDHKLPLVLVEDVASALVAARAAPGIDGQTFNLSAPALLTAREYVDELQHHAGMQIQVFAVPIWRHWLEDVAKWIVKGLVRYPDRSRLSRYHDWLCRTFAAPFDCSAAERALGWRPVADRDEIVRRGIQAPLDDLLAE